MVGVKNTRKISSASPRAFYMELLGSIIYMVLAFAVTGFAASAGSYANTQWNGAGALWLPVLYAAAIVSAIALFFLSFANAGEFNNTHPKKTYVFSLVGGFSLIALTFNSSLFLGAIIGFVLAFVGVLSEERVE